MKLNNLLVANSLRKFFVQQQHSMALDHHQHHHTHEPQQHQQQLFDHLNFNPATCHNVARTMTFQYDELIVCR
jgi:hypothetical protein